MRRIWDTSYWPRNTIAVIYMIQMSKCEWPNKHHVTLGLIDPVTLHFTLPLCLRGNILKRKKVPQYFVTGSRYKSFFTFYFSPF